MPCIAHLKLGIPCLPVFLLRIPLLSHNNSLKSFYMGMAATTVPSAVYQVARASAALWFHEIFLGFHLLGLVSPQYHLNSLHAG